jgi:hypothetical protein
MNSEVREVLQYRVASVVQLLHMKLLLGTAHISYFDVIDACPAQLVV